MNIDRKALLDELDRFARSGNGLITGAPGAGKTFAVRALSERWDKDGTKHLVIPVEQLGAATSDDLAARYRGERNLVSLLEKTFAAGVGVVMFDGIDAARNEMTRERVLGLVRQAITRLLVAGQ
jgi:MoxR-like ATPase